MEENVTIPSDSFSTLPPSSRVEFVFNPAGEIRVVDSQTGGEKTQKIARFDLLPMDALWVVAEVYGVGARLKYSDRNWERGYAWGLSVGALLRHLALWCRGETYDKETCLRHLAQVVWHGLALLTFELRGLGIDDIRSPKTPRADPL